LFEPRTRISRIAYGAILAALVTATTSSLTISIPATRGYFNLGDMMVYTAAVLTGPLVGALAGGIGSAISDVLLSPSYAPGTLIIKGMEGLIVGYLYRGRESAYVGRHWRAITSAMSATVFVLVAVATSFYYNDSGIFGMSPLLLLRGGYPYSLQYGAWLTGGLVVAIVVLYAGLRSDPRLGWMAMSIVVGGSEMVLGYFLYETSVLGIPVPAALVEVPFNVGQLIFGLAGAVFITESVAAAFRRPVSQTQRPPPP
jgi:uncharacterized membrane protein